MSQPRKKSTTHPLPKNQIDLRTFILRVLKQVHPDTSITQIAKDELNAWLFYIGQTLAKKAVGLVHREGKQTITSHDVGSAVRLVIPSELAKHCMSEGTKSTTKFNASLVSKRVSSIAKRSGLTFPPSRMRQFFTSYKIRVGRTAPVYFAAVLEYLAAEMLELSGTAARNDKRSRITIRHLTLAQKNDEELSKLTRDLGIQMAGGGVVPQIHPSLFPTKEQKMKQKKTTRKAISGEKLPHRWRAGTVALREIRKLQKQSNCVHFPRLSFSRLVREIGQDFSEYVNYTADAMLAIQMYIEHYLVGLLQDANLNVIHANRIRMYPKDIRLARRVRGEWA